MVPSTSFVAQMMNFASGASSNQFHSLYPFKLSLQELHKSIVMKQYNANLKQFKKMKYNFEVHIGDVINLIDDNAQSLGSS